MKNIIKSVALLNEATPSITIKPSKAFLHWVAISFTTGDQNLVINDFCRISGITSDVRNCSDTNAIIAYHAKSGIFISEQNSMLLRNRFGNNTHTLIINGNDCLQIKCWKAVKNYFEKLPNAKIKRVDITKDFKTGITLCDIKSAHRNEEFKINGQNPTIKSIGEYEYDNGEEARTLEIGKRENGKSMRAYEIGRKIKSLRRSEIRLEVEFRSTKSRVIPFGLLLNPESYFSGAYPYLSKFSNCKSSKMDFRKSEKNYDYFKKVESLKNSYGQTINLMSIVEGCPQAVFDLIRRKGFPSGMTPLNIKAITKPNKKT